jgi:hypothetical protein|uniref:Uncharacterized protein n=1 Tax=Oryza sativa subsp. japonica TaxID=39947 RepID=Q654E9_ORYSJ|nr:hypothetical protein [Oryza sativa Japonica Group]BAD61679.1 hypothetical protein [Oryza sativa Japonica Group]
MKSDLESLIENTLAELHLLFAHLPATASGSLLALGLSSCKNLCIQPQPSSLRSRRPRLRRHRPLPPHRVMGTRQGHLRPAAAAGDLTSYMPLSVYTLADLRALG